MARRVVDRTRMRSTTFAALLVLGATTAAHADGVYGGIGLGGSVGVDGQAAQRYEGADTSGLLMVGSRLSDFFSLELQLREAELEDASLMRSSASSIGAGGKVHLPFLLGFELYVKGNVSYGKITSDDTSASDWRGRGYGYGVGLMWALRVLPLVDVGVFVDLDKQIHTYHRDGADLDSEMRYLTLGVAAGTTL